MLLPVYRHALPADTKPGRRAAIEAGCLPVHNRQLMQEVMGGNHRSLHLRILDADTAASGNLVFDEDPKLTARRAQDKAWFLRVIRVDSADAPGR